MKRLRKRICGAGILFLMMILAIGTMVSFAEERQSSYKLIIQKIFADGTPPGANDVTYTFRVQAQVKGVDNPVEQTVRIKGAGQEEISFENAFKISVIEQTDDGGFEEAGNEWDVVKTSCESSMHVAASQATVNISKDGGMIKVTRPAGVPTVTFRLTGKPFHGGNEQNYGQKTVTAGSTVEWTSLPQGEYTITKLRSADGFSVLVGSREIDVQAGGTGKVHINGSESQISITAPSRNANEPIRTHHYLISGPVTREIDVRSGEIGTVEHLTEGDYTIKVSKTYNGVSGYTVTLPQTVDKSRTEDFSSFDGKYHSYTVGGDYIDTFKYGWLTRNGKSLPETTLYKFYYKIYENPEDTSPASWVKSSAKGNTRYTVNKTFYPGPDNRLRVAVVPIDGHDISGSICTLSWVEHTRKEVNYTIPKTETWYKVPIDDRGWFTITKPADNSDSRSQEVSYNYTITDSNGSAITGFTVDAKDADGNQTNVTVVGSTVTLKAGQSVTIGGLHAGNFRIYEKATPAAEMGFTVELKDTEKKATAPGETIEIEILGERTVEISRPGNQADDGSRLYTYNIYESGSEEPVRTIRLHSGETTTVAEATGSKLPAGKYRIKAVDDAIVGFDVTYSDSSSLTSDYIKTATVAFTNYFDKVEASYHVVHEYYLKNADGSYTFEGASPVYTKNCDGKHDDKDGHTSDEVHQLNVYKGNEYTHISDGGDAYGKVVSWNTGSEPKNVTSVLLPEDNRPGNSNFVLDGKSDSGEDENGRIRYQYSYTPLINLDFATALPHEEADQIGAQIIILRYYREDTPEEHGKYNIIHEYYRRTDHGDVWEGSSAPIEVDVGRLTNENRYRTYDAKDVTLRNRFTPKNDVEYPYVYDSAVYGRITTASADPDKPGILGNGKVYQTDATMTNVKATEAGDQIIILRYYRGGGYKVVHEYYYREAADFDDDSGDTEEESGGTAGENPEGEPIQAADSENNPQQNGENTAADQNTVSGNNPPESTVLSIIPPRPDSYNANAAPNAENSVSDNNPPHTGGTAGTGQDGKNDISGNNPQDTGGAADTAQEEKESAGPEAYGIMARDGDENSFNGTLTDEDGYIFEFEGRRTIVSYSADLESRHDAGGVRKENRFQPAGDEQHLYAFKDAVYGYVDENNPDSYRVAPYMTGVTATSNEDEIIILRYIRGEGVKEPEPPTEEEPPGGDTPEKPPGGGGGGGSNPPPEEEEIPDIPDLPTELPDPNDPDSPDRITILEDGVPRTYVKVWDFDKQQWVYIPEEDVPRWKTSPQTADEGIPVFWFVLTAGSAGGIVLLRSVPKKKR